MRYLPIDKSELPDEFPTSDATVVLTPLSYEIFLTPCEDCGPEVFLTVESLWLIAENTNFAHIYEISTVEEIMFNYGG